MRTRSKREIRDGKRIGSVRLAEVRCASRASPEFNERRRRFDEVSASSNVRKLAASWPAVFQRWIAGRQPAMVFESTSGEAVESLAFAIPFPTFPIIMIRTVQADAMNMLAAIESTEAASQVLLQRVTAHEQQAEDANYVARIAENQAKLDVQASHFDELASQLAGISRTVEELKSEIGPGVAGNLTTMLRRLESDIRRIRSDVRMLR